jgi:hypothetical protein
MGVIDETAQWVATVYQIETGDPANGGPDAPDNVQARALADRTLYLKNEVEALEASVAGIDLSVFLETADLLNAVKAVDGAGSGLDADLLDGLHASAFARTSDLTGLLATANLLTAMKAVDGAGSGLDADLLDGLHASAFARTSDLTGLLATANLLTAMKAVDGAGSGLDADLLDGLHASAFARTSDLTGLLATANLLTAMKAVDGAGSGLDADLLDGLHASQFLRSDVNDTITATLTANRLDAAFVTGGGDELFVGAGDFADVAEGNLIFEALYLAGDAGVKVLSSPDNLASGWAGRHEATLLDTQGNTHFPGRVYIAGGQTWFRIQRSPNTLHLNTLGTAISVSILLGEGQHFEIWDGIAYTRQYTGDRETDSGAFLGEITIPNGWGWRLVGGSAVQAWELR